MQYILSKEELDQLKANAANAIKKVTADLQTACTMVANHKPITVPWDRETKAVWGCILTVTHEHYCDHCPAQKICPHPNKNWSK